MARLTLWARSRPYEEEEEEEEEGEEVAVRDDISKGYLVAASFRRSPRSP